MDPQRSYYPALVGLFCVVSISCGGSLQGECGDGTIPTQEPDAIAQIEAIVGLPEETARSKTLSDGLAFFVYERDGELQPRLLDINLERVTVCIDEGKVSGGYRG